MGDAHQVCRHSSPADQRNPSSSSPALICRCCAYSGGHHAPLGAGICATYRLVNLTIIGDRVNVSTQRSVLRSLQGPTRSAAEDVNLTKQRAQPHKLAMPRSLPLLFISGRNAHMWPVATTSAPGRARLASTCTAQLDIPGSHHLSKPIKSQQGMPTR